MKLTHARLRHWIIIALVIINFGVMICNSMVLAKSRELLHSLEIRSACT